jgi:hypothetical protein
MSVNYGRLDGDTREGRVYGYLKSRPGEWFTTMEVTNGAQVPSMSTAVSGVREQLPVGERIEMKKERGAHKTVWFYRWVRVPAVRAIAPAPVPSSGQCGLFTDTAA